MRFTPDNITSLAPNEVFVFGSNDANRHGAGAAKQALKWGAKIGYGGLQGQTYGIATKDKYIRTHSLWIIEQNVDKFVKFAKTRPDLIFLCTKIGMGLAGLSLEEIAPMFREARSLENVVLPKEFHDYLDAERLLS